MWELILGFVAGVLAWAGGVFALVPAVELFSEGPRIESPQKTITVMFGGDIMLDRALRIAADEKGEDYLFSCIADTFAKPDLFVANLEGPITRNPSVSVGSVVGSPENFTFTFATTTAQTLKRNHVDIVSLGNNHILNQGNDGVRQTTQYLREAGVGYFGDPLENTIHVEDIEGIRMAFVGYNEWDYEAASTTLAQITNTRADGALVIVFAHWGDEYQEQSHPRQQNLAHRFIDAGAEMVIGAHPHVIQESEQYKGKYIYYSLGNLMFDQYWEDAVRTGLLLTAELSRDGVQGVSEVRTYLERDRRTCLKKQEPDA